MAQLFDDVFAPQSIYEMLFFNVKSVLIHPTIAELEANDKTIYDRWINFVRSEYVDDTDSLDVQYMEKLYQEKAPYLPEFSKIVAITYGTVYIEDGKLKRYMKKIVNEDEFIVLATFMDELFQVSSDDTKSTPNFFPILCGHDIIKHDIPFLIKKFIQYNDRFETNKKIPLILKRSLSIKPWESGVIDTVNVWKFNGYDDMSLMLISDFLGLKKTVDLESNDVISKNYWKLVKTNPEKALEFVSLQSATQTNLVIQLMVKLRSL